MAALSLDNRPQPVLRDHSFARLSGLKAMLTGKQAT
jgi:hypothetical protein